MALRRINLWLALLALLLVAFALRVFRLEFQSLWYDEAFSVYLAHASLAEITARTAADIQPPLYYYLLHIWSALAGESEFAVRFMSLGFGLLTLPLMYVTARRLFDTSAALVSAALGALAPLYVWYSQEARMYTLITFLLLLSSYALLRASGARERAYRWWLVFAVANIAAVYTHYFSFAVVAFQLLWVVVSSYRFQGYRLRGYRLRVTELPVAPLEVLKPATISVAGVFVAFLPWLPFVIARFGQDASYWRGALKLDEALRHILISFTTGESVLEDQARWIALGWLGVLVIGMIAMGIMAKVERQKEKAGRSFIFVALYLLVPLALLLLLFYRNPKFNARYLMIASPPFFLLLASGLASLLALVRSKNLLGRAAASSVFLLTFSFCLLTFLYSDANAYFDPAFTKASFREVARYVEEHIAPDEAVILTSGHLFPSFDYYFRGDVPQIRMPDDPTLNAEHILGFDAANVLNRTLAGKRGTWVVLWQDEVVDPNGFLPMLLSSQGQEQKIQGTSFYQVRLRHWALAPNARFTPEPQPGTPRVANFKDQVKLLGWDSPAPSPADSGASFNLYWQSLDTLTLDYQVALRVQDAAGNLIGKQDRRPAGYTYPTTRWKKGENLFGAYTVPLVAGAPAGDYFVELTVYAASNPSGLDVLAPSGAPLGRSVKLGPIPVLPATKPAEFAALNIQNTISEPIGPFTLLGYQLGRDKASAGESIPLTLFWRADNQPDCDYSFRVQFGDTTSDAFPLANAKYPTSQWRRGEVVRGQYAIAIPATAQAGTSKLRIALSDGKELELAPFTVEKTDRVFVKPSMSAAQNANFNNSLALVGYDLPSSVRPGDTLKLTLYWQARAKMDKPYTVFVHLLDKENKVVAQRDSEPVAGARPTTGWVANEYIADTYELKVDPDTAPGKYQVEIGWYDAKDPSYARLQVLDEGGAPVGDHVILLASLVVQ